MALPLPLRCLAVSRFLGLVGWDARCGVLSVQTLTPWTDDEVARLLTYHREGRSAAAIAAAMGKTRNAVLGKLMRERNRAANGSKPRTGSKRRASISNWLLKPWSVLLAPLRMKETPWDSVPPDAPGLLLVAGLQPHHCRFALNNALQGQFYFCGKDRKPRSPYCDEHHSICYIKN